MQLVFLKINVLYFYCGLMLLFYMEVVLEMEVRLQNRYERLVRSHMQIGHELSPGIKNILSKDRAFNQTQAAWRFFNNEHCTLQELSEPLLKAANESSEQECDDYQLVPHDWSYLSYGSHKSKQDVYNTIKKGIGYDLQTSLMISDRHGGPLALVAMNLKTKERTFSTYDNKLEGLTHLEELSKRIDWLESQQFKKPLVHIIDREADSIAFLRALEGKNWIIRANDTNFVHDGLTKQKLKELAKGLLFSHARTVEYKGVSAQQHIAEADVTITRAAQPKRKNADGKRLPRVQGDPVKVRLIVSRITNDAGKELAVWYLLSKGLNVSAPTIALWYYWRWSIESYFKLMKSAGMQLESWQQTTGEAIARRLLVASMACVYVWRIAHAKGPEAGELRQVLVRLSGRQMKWKKEFTYNSLYAGLCSLLALQDLLETYDVDKIRSLISEVWRDKRLV